MRYMYNAIRNIHHLLKNFHMKMSFNQRLKSRGTMTRFDLSWKMIPESRSRDRKRPAGDKYPLKISPTLNVKGPPYP